MDHFTHIIQLRHGYDCISHDAAQSGIQGCERPWTIGYNSDDFFTWDKLGEKYFMFP